MASALSDDSVSYFLAQAGRIPLLTVDEELLVARDVQRWIEMRDQPDCPRKVQRRGERAYNRMFSANLRLVANVAKKYTYITKNLEYADLLQEGCLGLARAVEKFDPTRGYKFSTYAYWWIRQGITRAVSQTDRTIRLPVHATEAMARLRKWGPIFSTQFGRNPTLEECAEHLGMRPALLEGYLAHTEHPLSLDRLAGDEAKNSFVVDLIPSGDEDPLDALIMRMAREDVEERLVALTADQRDAMQRRLGMGPYKEAQTATKACEETGLEKERLRWQTDCAIRHIQSTLSAA